ncbi:MAG: exosortase/archaeosortase family protein [Planctomycetota bacterium]
MNRRQAFEAAAITAAFGAVLLEWAQYCSASSRLSYALFVPVLVLIVARLGGRKAAPTEGSSWMQSGLILLAAVLLAVGTLASVFTIALMGFPVAVTGLLLGHRGPSVLRRHGWAIALLFLIVPLPTPIIDRITPTLVSASGNIAAGMLSIGGEASWSGDLLDYKEHRLLVSEACSGSGTLFILVVLSTFLAGLFRLGLLTGIGAILFSIPLVAVVNGIRIALSAVSLDLFGVEAAEGAAHELLGIVLIVATAAALALLFSKVDRLRTRKVPA